MTKEEAIFYIKELQKTHASMDKKVAEAVDTAIKALQTDAVIRDDDKFYKGLYEMACKVVEGQAEAMKTYHKIFLLQEEELQKLRTDKCVSD